MKRSLALFKTKFSIIALDSSYSDNDDYVRITEAVEVDFPEVKDMKLKVRDAEARKIDKEIVDLQGKLYVLEEKKKELLCLTNGDV